MSLGSLNLIEKLEASESITPTTKQTAIACFEAGGAGPVTPTEH
jgi:hypothetical protein